MTALSRNLIVLPLERREVQQRIAMHRVNLNHFFVFSVYYPLAHRVFFRNKTFFLSLCVGAELKSVAVHEGEAVRQYCITQPGLSASRLAHTTARDAFLPRACVCLLSD